MPEEKVDWRMKVADIAEAIYKEASRLINWLSVLPREGQASFAIDIAISKLSEVVQKALIILQEVSKEEINWGKIIDAFPTREWLGSIEKTLEHLDTKFELYGLLKEAFLKNIWRRFGEMHNIFFMELGLKEIDDRYNEGLESKPPTEEELEREYKEATGKRVLQPKELKSLFDEISEILMRELQENPSFPSYWREIAQQFKSAVDAKDTQKLRDIHRQIVRIYDSWIAPKVKDLPLEEQEALKQFFGAMKDYILHLRKSNLPLLKFKLIRRLLGLE
jgi:hypothetical protein